MSVITSELETLLSKIPHLTQLSSDDLYVMDSATNQVSSPHDISSEMANLHSQIWIVIQNLHGNYWQVIGSLFSQSKSLSTQRLCLISMAKRIASEGRSYLQDFQLQIFNFYKTSENEILHCPQKQDLKNELGGLLAALLKCYWEEGYFCQFIENIREEINEISLEKLFYSLNIIKRIIQDGFTETKGKINKQILEFKKYVADQLRPIMIIILYCLKEAEHKDKTIPFAIQFITEITPIIPAFEIFNCDFIEKIVELLGEGYFSTLIIHCLKSIFQFKQCGESKEHHSKIAEKLFYVLQKLLNRYLRPAKGRQEKARYFSALETHSGSTKSSLISRSTQDSIYSKSTVNINGSSYQQDSRYFLALLHHFLERYVPYMDNSQSEDTDLQIQSSSNKLYFSPDLYSYIKEHYFQFMNFLREYGMQSHMNLVKKMKEEEQFETIFAFCVKYMLQLYHKLKLPFDPCLNEFLKMVILSITPFQKAFRQIYSHMELIMDHNKTYVYEEVKLFTDEYYENYRQIIYYIVSSQSLFERYMSILISFLNYVVQSTESDESMIAQLVNTINRSIWSLVSAKQCKQFSPEHQHFFSKIAGGMMGQAFNNEKFIIRKIFANNLKYFLQLDPIIQRNDILFSSLKQQDQPDLASEFSLLILKKVFSKPGYLSKQLGNNVDKIYQRLLLAVKKGIQVFRNGFQSKQYLEVFPGIFKAILQFGLEENLSDKRETIQLSKKLIKHLVYDYLNQCFESLSQYHFDIEVLNKTMQTLQFNSKICEFIQSQLNKIQNLDFYQLVYHYCILIKKLFFWQGHGHIYQDLSMDVMGCSRQNFEIDKANQFRDYYISFITKIMKIVALLFKEGSILREQKKKEAKQWLQLFQKQYENCLKDFTIQPHFKSIEFFEFSYQILNFNKKINLLPSHQMEKTVNQKITFISKVLHQELVEGYVNLEHKYIWFWKACFQSFGQEINSQNIDLFYQFYLAFDQHTMSIREILIEAVNTYFSELKTLKRQNNFWNHCYGFLEITFKIYFGLSEQNQELNRKIISLLYNQVCIISCSALQLSPHSNNQFIFSNLRSLVYSHVGEKITQQFSSQHDFMLRSVVQEEKYFLFEQKCRDYKTILYRQLQGNR